jgi:Type IV pilin-like G and H, putative
MKTANWFAICMGSIVLLPALVRAQPPQSIEASQQIIVGRWEGIYRETGTSMPLIFRFTATGKVVVAVPTENRQGLRAYWANYELDSKPQPMHIDLSFEGDREPIQTIVEVPNPQTLKLQMRPTESPRKRPTAFRDEVQFQKTSETAIAPLTQLSEAERSTSGEGQFVMTTLIRSAIVHRVETNQFAKHLTDLGLNSTSTQNYRFELLSKENQLTLIARPKKAGLKSYIAVISSEPSRDQGSTQLGAAATICQSVRSSKVPSELRSALIAPPMPKVSPRNSDKAYPIITCGSGSEPLLF